jgi:hypothetical protein
MLAALLASSTGLQNLEMAEESCLLPKMKMKTHDCYTKVKRPSCYSV